MKKVIVGCLTLMCLIFAYAFKVEAQQSKKPNILFIVADDAGRDFSAYGSTFVNTPGFDRVAKEGLLGLYTQRQMRPIS